MTRLHPHYRPLMWRVAYYILADEGASSLPVGDPIVQRVKSGGKHYQEWAIDLRRICPDSFIGHFDALYLPPGNDYRRVPRRLSHVARYVWAEAQARGVVSQGLRIIERLHG